MKNNRAASVNLKALELKEDVDGISFSIDEDKSNEDQIAWNFTVMRLNGKEESDFIQTEIGYKYQILLYNGEEADFFEAILGDVHHYIKGLVRVGQEGIILKKCKKSDEIMDKIFRGRALEALAKTLIQVKQEAV